MIKKNIYKFIAAFAIPLTLIMSTSSIVACGKKQPINDGSWKYFLHDAKNVTAKNLKTTMTDEDLLDNFHWKTNNVAIFGVGGKPHQNGKLEEVVATIVVKDAATSSLFPINFNIKYPGPGHKYDFKGWKHHMNIYDVTSWDAFKAKALSVQPKDLLNFVKTRNSWATFHWYGNLQQRTWANTDTAEFDTFGGLNIGTDPFRMSGKPIADDSDYTIIAIISIKGKEGNYDANPIKATATYIPDVGDAYDITKWTFKQDEQIQSLPKYNSLVTPIAKEAKSDDSNGADWVKFTQRIWISPLHSNDTTLEAYFKNTLQLSVAEYSHDSVYIISKPFYDDHKTPIGHETTITIAVMRTVDRTTFILSLVSKSKQIGYIAPNIAGSAFSYDFIVTKT